jgi:probable phosphoglycerate mutase
VTAADAHRGHTELIVVRHGETIWNADRRMQGQQDSPLSERGRAQALALGIRFMNEPFDHLYSSDLARAYQTAAAIADRTGHEIKVYALPGGECTREFFARSMACFNDIGGRHTGERVVVVAHGMLLDALYRAARGLDLISARDVDLINASLNVFRFESDRWEMHHWGDCSHLDEITMFQSR